MHTLKNNRNWFWKKKKILLTSESITMVVIHCSEIIRQKSGMVVSNGSWVIMNVSVLSYPSMNEALM